MAFGDDAKPAEEFDAQSPSTSHSARLYTVERAVDFVVMMNLMCDLGVQPAVAAVAMATATHDAAACCP